MTFQAAPGQPKYATEVHLPSKLTSIDTGRKDVHGRPIQVACVTCHSLEEKKSLPVSTEELDQFHRGLELEHGSLECASCHDSEVPQRLRLAAGHVLSTTEVMRLCGQCHGPQLRDYEHGAHGGMNGSWDLSRGPRSRNNCVDCHDPHAPAIAKMHPVHPPRDRFLTSEASHPGEQGGEHR